MKSQINVTVERAAIDQAKVRIRSVRELIPTPVVLTPDEIRGMAKYGPKSKAFVGRAQEYASNSAFSLSLINVEEFTNDITIAETYNEIEAELDLLAVDVRSMAILAGSEAYSHALLLYKSLQILSQQNVPGAKAAYEDLRSLYPGYGRPKNDPNK
ncbi:hypothetical protein [Williamwhitmania taraxaci]|uniref:Uncharacterized protein n=1 Tax=Williamwhitmania taraxaci TaxID=1640674 RepID=A0A1G6I0P8_9BACT|nr:hypothetical protein [Williamwhitmania taraxaci]SDC00031.1 hypothetical protein SAMN05216323_101416 [Williamwhitmania taraxaci]